MIIRGAPASGKTTIAKRFRSYDKKIAWLKVDNFKDFFSANASLGEQRDVDETALASLKHLLDQSFSVIMEKIFYDPYIIPLALDEARKRKIIVKVFQIKCAEEILIERDATRDGVKEGCRKPLGDINIKNIARHLDQTVIKDAVILDTGKLSIDECVSKINQELDN